MSSNFSDSLCSRALTPAWRWLLILAIAVGVGCRLWKLDHKVYWHDESFTTFRAAGYLETDIKEFLFQGEPIKAPELQRFFTIKADSTYLHTLRSLAIEDSQHTPLYFLIARRWMQAFGSSIWVSRLLPVLISLLSLPLMFCLALELFSSSLVAWLSTALLAFSPIDILIAQTARQYSLLSLTVIASSWLFLRATRLDRGQDWALFGISLVIGLYSHLLFFLTWLAYGIWIVWPSRQYLLKFTVISGLGWLLFLPWLVVLFINRQRALATTSWTNTRLDWLVYPKVWLLRFSSLLFDTDYYQNVGWSSVPRILVIVLFMVSFWLLIIKASPGQRSFVLAIVLGPFLAFAITDLVLGGNRSTVTRYILGAFPGVHLATGFCLAYFYCHRRRLAQIVWGLIFAGSLTSCFVSAQSETWWTKNISYYNGEIADFINQADSPLLVTDIKVDENAINLGNLLALSYRLNENVILLPFSEAAPHDSFTLLLTSQDYTPLAYNLSSRLEADLAKAGFQWQPTDLPDLYSLR
jgi:uncharacterized membrane protein